MSRDEDPRNWVKKAACRGMAPLFDAEPFQIDPTSRHELKQSPTPPRERLARRVRQEHNQYRVQLRVCATCPVRRECLKEAMEWEPKPYSGRHETSLSVLQTNTQGVLGATTPTQRLLWHAVTHLPKDNTYRQAARQSLALIRSQSSR